MKIDGSHPAYFVGGLYQQESRLTDGHLKGDEHRCHRHADAYGAEQDANHLGQIAPPQCLRGHAAAAHTQETEYPVDDVKQHSAHGDGADVGRCAEVSHDGHVDEAEQGHGDVGHDGRQGNLQDLAVSGLHEISSFFFGRQKYIEKRKKRTERLTIIQLRRVVCCYGNIYICRWFPETGNLDINLSILHQ